jgi:hypothetical protein
MAFRPTGALPSDWKPRAKDARGDLARAVIADIRQRFQQHADEGTLPRSPRGIFYDLRPRGLGWGVTYTKPTKERPASAFEPWEVGPKYVAEQLVCLRRAGIIPWSWVSDQRAATPITWFFDDYNRPIDKEAESVIRYVHAAHEHYALDPQARQACYLEVFCEAEDMMPRLARITEP